MPVKTVDSKPDTSLKILFSVRDAEHLPEDLHLLLQR